MRALQLRPTKLSRYQRLKKWLYKRLIRPFLDDETVVRFAFRNRFGKPLNLTSPKSFNEKMQWIKLYDRNPLMKLYADKYEVRKIVEDKVGSTTLNELYGVFKSVEEIDFDSLPQSFILKVTHGSGWNVIVKNKSVLDIKKTKKKMRKWMAADYYKRTREWSYKHILPRIVCEKYMENKDGSLIDYKLFCFNGTPLFIQVDLDRYTGHTRAFYTVKWQKLDFLIVNKSCSYHEKEVKRPNSLMDMIEIAEALSNGFTFARVDMYDVDGKAVFGEVTFYPGGGWERFSPERWDVELGNLLQLPEKPSLTTEKGV